MKLIDTNVIIRYLTNDDPDKAKQCEKLFEKAIKGKEKLILNHLIIAEIVWVLEGVYKISGQQIMDSVLKILNTPNIKIPDEDLIFTTFSIWQLSNFKIDYIDAYNTAFLETHDLQYIYSYDTDFDLGSLAVKRLEP